MTASRRGGGGLLPLPDTIRPGGGATKALKALLARGLAEERPTTEPAIAWRTEGDRHHALVITAAGLCALGLEAEESGAEGGETAIQNEAAAPASVGAPAPAGKAGSKTATVLGLLGQAEGASLVELVTATGWLPHSTRAALTGLRKKGHAIARVTRDGTTCYRLNGVS